MHLSGATHTYSLHNSLHVDAVEGALCRCRASKFDCSSLLILHGNDFLLFLRFSPQRGTRWRFVCNCAQSGRQRAKFEYQWALRYGPPGGGDYFIHAVGLLRRVSAGASGLVSWASICGFSSRVVVACGKYGYHINLCKRIFIYSVIVDPSKYVAEPYVGVVLAKFWWVLRLGWISPDIWAAVIPFLVLNNFTESNKMQAKQKLLSLDGNRYDWYISYIYTVLTGYCRFLPTITNMVNAVCFQSYIKFLKNHNRFPTKFVIPLSFRSFDHFTDQRVQ